MVLMPGALDILARIATAHPKLKLILDHVGLRATGKGAAAFADLPAVLALAKHPNVAVKASGMPSLSAEGHRRAAVAERRGPRVGDGPRRLRVARLAAARQVTGGLGVGQVHTAQGYRRAAWRQGAGGAGQIIRARLLTRAQVRSAVRR